MVGSFFWTRLLFKNNDDRVFAAHGKVKTAVTIEKRSASDPIAT